MSLPVIPLFPLQVVLYPRMPLPLHIFEPRYREMVGRCLAEKLEFGVVLATREGMARAGCTAEIEEVVKKYPDGRMDIETSGRRRFRVVELVEERAYLQGEVDFLADGPDPDAELEPARPLQSLYEEILSLLTGQPPPEQTYAEDQLSFQLASVLPLDLAYKQELLELTSEGSRRRSLLAQMEKFARQLRRLKKVKTVAGGNGRGG